MRRSSLLLGALMAGLLVAPFPPPTATGSCVPPTVELGKDTVLTPGGSASVKGSAFKEGCNDTGGCTSFLGCEDCHEEPEVPYDDIELRLRQGGHTWTLGVADAGSAADSELGQVEWTFLVPRAARPGRATLLTDYSDPLRIRIR